MTFKIFHTVHPKHSLLELFFFSLHFHLFCLGTMWQAEDCDNAEYCSGGSLNKSHRCVNSLTVISTALLPDGDRHMIT